MIALLKAKSAWMLATPIGLIVGFVLMSCCFLARGAILLSQEPSIPEIERHLERNDTRIDAHDAKFEKILELINQKFEKEAEGRESLTHEVTYIYGGLGVIGIMLAVGVIKLNAGVSGMDKEDLQQLALLARELRSPRGRR